MLGVFAEFETNLRREQQMAGIAAAKEQGVYKGRKAKIDPEEVRRLHTEEKLSPSAIARHRAVVGVQVPSGRQAHCRVMTRCPFSGRKRAGLIQFRIGRSKPRRTMKLSKFSEAQIAFVLLQVWHRLARVRAWVEHAGRRSQGNGC